MSDEREQPKGSVFKKDNFGDILTKDLEKKTEESRYYSEHKELDNKKIKYVTKNKPKYVVFKKSTIIELEELLNKYPDNYDIFHISETLSGYLVVMKLISTK